MVEVVKGRVFWCIIYPEGISYSQIIEKLNGLKTEIAVSPLHAPDKCSIDKYEFKPHVHAIFKFSGNKTNVQLYSMLLALDLVCHIAGYREGDTDGNIARGIKLVDNIVVATRYLIHADDSEKQQFNNGFQAIRCLHGYDLGSAIASNYNERFNIYFEIINFCKQHQCYWFHDLIDYAQEQQNMKWLNYLQNNSFNVQLYLSSYTKKQEYLKKIKEKELMINMYEKSLSANTPSASE